MVLAGRPRASARIRQPGRAGLGGRHRGGCKEGKACEVYHSSYGFS